MQTATPLSLETTVELYETVKQLLIQAPLFRPRMPKSGVPFQYEMSNCGDYGWVADKNGYYYTMVNQFMDNQPWPEMPQLIKDIAIEAAHQNNFELQPQTCLINVYRTNQQLGLHQDNTEQNLTAPVISISLGCDGVFAVGGMRYTDPTRDVILHNGDVILLGGASRLQYHAMKGIVLGTSPIPELNNQRINLTIRQVV